MTLAAGFRCSDGVVLCADTEMTMPGFIKFPGSKLRGYQKLNFRPAFVFAGDVNFCATMIGKLLGKIVSAGTTASDALIAIEKEALLIHQTYIGEDYEAQSSLLMSLWRGTGNKGRRQLFQVGRGFVSPVSEGFLGTGQSVARAMSAELFTSGMSVEQAALMASLILAEAKTYSYGVGKESQILILNDRGSWNIFPNDPFRHSSISEIEEDYTKLKRALRSVLLLHADRSVALSLLRESLDNFTRTVFTNSNKRAEIVQKRIEAEIESQFEQPEDHSDEDPSNSEG